MLEARISLCRNSESGAFMTTLVTMLNRLKYHEPSSFLIVSRIDLAAFPVWSRPMIPPGMFPQNARIVLLIIATCLPMTCARGEDADLEFFEKRIRPVLASNCYECHGPDKQESDLRVDHRSFLIAEGNFGPVVVPGAPGQSQLFVSLTHETEDLRMPLDRERLPDGVIADFRRWIEQGAAWPEEDVPVGKADEFDLDRRRERLPWIWQSPARESKPRITLATWPRSTIDHFILHDLEQRSLEPALEASPEVWLRRVHFAIVGLPPSPEQIDRFLDDPSERAYERVVDELLQSPHFGERWARHWMDLVRYAESRGHESDFVLANAWHYRDYLIRAFNDDLPYDAFIREHVAGDMLDQPRINPISGGNESVLATAWPYFGEEVHSPVDIRQDECDRIDNKIDVLCKTFLGLTVACARCHDHKFDAISQSDYYAMAGFMLGSSYRQVRFESDLRNRDIAERLERASARFQRDVRPLVGRAPSNLGQIEELISSGQAEPPLLPVEMATEGEVVADYSDAATPWLFNGFAFGLRPRVAGEFVIDDDALKVVPKGHAAKDIFWDVLKASAGNQNDSGSQGGTKRAGRMIRTPTFTIRSGQIHYLFEGEAQVYAAVDSHLMVKGPLHGGLVTTISADEPTWITHDLRDYIGHRAHVEFGAVAAKPCKVFRVVDAAEKPAPSTSEPKPASVVESLAIEAFSHLHDGTLGDQENCELLATLINWVLARPNLFPVEPPVASEIRAAIDQYSEARDQLAQDVRRSSRTAVAMMSGNGVDEHVLLRGNPNRPGDVAVRRLPRAMVMFDKMNVPSSGRLELAEAIADPRNPLTSRVIVNRLWHHLFGRGIVASVDNFGWLGERPTHPEMLDHLAHSFVTQHDWSIKKMIKEIVLSSTYRQSSRPRDERAERIDPENEWLHRMPVRRLEAESIRDNVLAVSGRLDRTMFGAPVPVHLDEFVIGRGRPTESGPLDGHGRRSIYTSVRRNFLPTIMLTFDMPTPFSTIGRRNVTNVPAQSLALANDKFIHAQARLWAQRLVREYPDLADRIDRAHIEAFGRKATPSECDTYRDNLQVLATLQDKDMDHEDVWTGVCHTLFRVNEFIYVR